MNVAVVLPELDPHQGGGFTFQESIYQALREASGRVGHRFTYYVNGAAGEGDLRPLRLDRPAVAARALHQLIRHLEDDVLDVPRRLSPRTAFERSLARDQAELVWFATPWADDCDLPYVFTVWDLEYLRQPWFPEVSARGEWRRRHRHYSRYLPAASAVIVPNAEGARQVTEHFGVPAERMLELPHPTPAFALTAGAAAGPAPAEPPYLLYPAQLWPHKDHATLLEAVRLLADRGTPYELVLVGSDKGSGGHLRARAESLGIAERVRFRGFVPTEELVELYRGAHALVYPSRFGPENLPPLEAFALGCPVVAVDVAGAAEQLGDAAVRVPVGDAGAIAEAVAGLEDGERRAGLAAAGRERARARSAEAYVDGVLEWIDAFEPTRRGWR